MDTTPRRTNPEPDGESRENLERKKMMTDPDGNLYRGWAIGLHEGYRLRLMTWVVILVQIIVPMAVLIHALPYLATHGGFVYIWEADMKLDDGLKKVAGVLLLALVFMNGESIMKRTDMQTDKLRDLYSKTLSRVWMFTDAFCNSWCISLCALCTPCLLWTADDPKELVLDAFGVLFLHNLDEYSGDLEYGVEVSDFDDLIEVKIDEKTKRLLDEDEGEENFAELRAEKWEKHWKQGCFAYGDICYSIGRLVNLLIMHFTLPAFAMLKWEADTAERKYSLIQNSQFFLPTTYCGCIALVSMLLRFGYRFVEFLRMSEKSEESQRELDHPLQDEVQIVKKDFLGFVSHVVLGRHDPRAPPQLAAFKQ